MIATMSHYHLMLRFSVFYNYADVKNCIIIYHFISRNAIFSFFASY